MLVYLRCYTKHIYVISFAQQVLYYSELTSYIPKTYINIMFGNTVCVVETGILASVTPLRNALLGTARFYLGKRKNVSSEHNY